MAALPLGIHPAFAPWHLAGVRHLYLDDAALAALREAQADDGHAPTAQHAVHGAAQHTGRADPGGTISAASRSQRAAGGTGTGSNADGGAIRHHAPATDETSSGPENAIRTRPTRPERQPSQTKRPSTGEPEGQGESHATRPAPVTLGVEATSLPPEQWPAVWGDLFTRTAAGSPLLWTYWALGDDLCGKPDDTRRQLLRRILGALAMPRGTHSFWPVALPDEASGGDLVANGPVFHAALHRLAPRCVLLMGSRALKAVAPGLQLRPFQQVNHQGRLFIVLPDMDMLLQDPSRADAVVAYLRPTLMPFARR